MIPTGQFGAELHRLGFHFYTGVPCSYLKNLINYAINDCEYIGAANEGDAVAIAAGAYLGGKKPVVLMQNSGLGNAVSPLTSLLYPFRIPLLGFVSLRGEPGVPDEPQHELMGQITPQMLELMQVEWQYLSSEMAEAKQQLLQAVRVTEQNRPFFFVVRKGTFEPEELRSQTPLLAANQTVRVKHKRDQLPTRYEALSLLHAQRDSHTVYLATTGKTGRELYDIADHAGNFYMVGSMGCISSFGLGLALTQTKKDIVAIDGDGSLLMRMGALSTIGCYGPSNLLHILLDNNAHDSTGGQKTVSHNLDFVKIAAASGYAHSIYVHQLSELEAVLSEWKEAKKLTFLHMRIAAGSKEPLGRPHIRPFEVKERLVEFLGK
ncbi:phosphonopyruvate decarboxylase [Paenibacillus durus]|uniref:3-phosphonopyruvate decarboxylase n=1 Tax=Paenibacillus durus ATCC 35681 TaxID=1333534 RepID=A0A0F7F9A8_PAEDU|nr:phosphonopyruvate decarboxylase [Paenibacillus durus]AKG35037.1 3-phosphonopyruvate decarboxylase [Paenibacillus durus ATCC 35681]